MDKSLFGIKFTLQHPSRGLEGFFELKIDITQEMIELMVVQFELDSKHIKQMLHDFLNQSIIHFDSLPDEYFDHLKNCILPSSPRCQNMDKAF